MHYRKITRMVAWASLTALGLSPAVLQAQEPTPILEWQTFFGPDDFFHLTSGNGVAVDPQGNVYQAGYILDFRRPGLCGSGFLNKYGSNGTLLWSQNFLEPGQCGFAFRVAVDTNGFVYATGARTDINGRNSSVVLGKWDFNGLFKWRVPFKRGLFDRGVGLDFDPVSQTVYVLDQLCTDTNACWLRYDTAGNLLHAQPVNFAGSRIEEGADLAADATGLTVLTETIIVSPPMLRPRVTRYGLDGNVVWTNPLISVPSEDPADIDFDSRGNAIAGIAQISATRSFGLAGIDPEGGLFLVIKGDIRESRLSGSAVDASGSFYGFGSAPFFPRVFLAQKYNPLGSKLWQVTNSFFNRDAFAIKMAVDRQGQVYLSGIVQTPAFGLRAVVAKYRQAPKGGLKIALDPAETSPGGSTLVTVTAVDASGSPQPGVGITLTAEAVAGSGGHGHEVGRPTGTFSGAGITHASPAHGTTGPDGKLAATYKATEFGGVETIKAHLTDTPSVSTSAALEVRVKDLFLAPTSGVPLRYNFTGDTSSHTTNHYASTFTVTGTTTAAVSYFNRTGSHILGINDMALVFGGLFDIGGDWRPPHSLHREGRSVDVDRCAASTGELVLVNQLLLDKFMRAVGGARIVERALVPPPCPGSLDTPRMHYEF